MVYFNHPTLVHYYPRVQLIVNVLNGAFLVRFNFLKHANILLLVKFPTLLNYHHLTKLSLVII